MDKKNITSPLCAVAIQGKQSVPRGKYIECNVNRMNKCAFAKRNNVNV